MFTEFEMFWGGCFLYFDECRKKWKISREERAEIIYKYKLVTLIENSDDFLYSYCDEDVVKIIEQYIKRMDKINEVFN